MRRPRSLATVIAAVVAAGCGVPTSAPIIESTWVLAGDSTTIGASALLPRGVSLDDSTLALDVASATASPSLTELCGVDGCRSAGALTVVKPPFSSPAIEVVSALPSEVASVALIGGTIHVAISNGFAFDPLRPAGADGPSGTLTLVARTAGRTIASRRISGADMALPPGSTLTLTLPLDSGSVSGAVTTSVQLDSPAGGPANLSGAQHLTITSTARAWTAREATVLVSGRTIDSPALSLNLGQISPELTSRARAGAITFHMENGLNVSGDLRLTISGRDLSITKPMALPAGASTSRVTLSDAEVQAILGRPGVTMRIAGPVSGRGPVTVRPAQSIAVRSRIELSLSTQS